MRMGNQGFPDSGESWRFLWLWTYLGLCAGEAPGVPVLPGWKQPQPAGRPGQVSTYKGRWGARSSHPSCFLLRALCP